MCVGARAADGSQGALLHLERVVRRSPDGELAFRRNVARVHGMEAIVEVGAARTSERSYLPSHVPSGAALLALELSEEARGVRGLDVLRRSVDRAPPVR